MKNISDFEKELEKLDHSGKGVLKELRDELRALSKEELPSGQSQRWAWTRFEAHMRGWGISAKKWWSVRAVGWGVVAMLTVWIGVSTWNAPLRDLPVVTAVHPTMSAVTFYSREADADVIWVDGYDYMPESYTIQ